MKAALLLIAGRRRVCGGGRCVRLVACVSARGVVSVPPARGGEPDEAGEDEDDADGDGDRARGVAEAVERLAGRVVRERERKGDERQLGGEDSAAEVVLDGALQKRRRVDPERAP